MRLASCPHRLQCPVGRSTAAQADGWSGRRAVPHQQLDLVAARVLVRRHAQELLAHHGAARVAQEVDQHRVDAAQRVICDRGGIGSDSGS